MIPFSHPPHGSSTSAPWRDETGQVWHSDTLSCVPPSQPYRTRLSSVCGGWMRLCRARTIDVHHELPVNLSPPADISFPIITHANMHHLYFSCNLPTGSSWGYVCYIWLSLSTIKRDSCSSDTVGSLIQEVREGQVSVRYDQLQTDRGGKYDFWGHWPGWWKQEWVVN